MFKKNFYSEFLKRVQSSLLLHTEISLITYSWKTACAAQHFGGFFLLLKLRQQIGRKDSMVAVCRIGKIIIF